MKANSENSSNEFTPPRHWLGVEELESSYWSDPAVLEKRAQEFHDKPVETIDLIDRLDTKGIARRDFLTIMGASMAMASFSCARRPVHKIIPYVVKPEEITHGVANYYATSCPETGYGILAKVREGRPVKLEGHPDHPVNRGALSGWLQASVLDLYDTDRAKEARAMNRGKGSKAISWEDLDKDLGTKLKAIAAGSGRIRLVSRPLVSESTKQLIQDFLGAFAAGSHIEFDASAPNEVAVGQLESYGAAVLPNYRFDQAKVVLSVGADFLGDGANSEGYSADWAKTRKLNSKDAKNAQYSKLFVLENMMSLTGANADERIPVRPGDELKLLAAIAAETARKKGVSVPGELQGYTLAVVAEETGVAIEKLSEIAAALAGAAGESIVIAGGLSTRHADSVAIQVIANFLNSALGNEGKTIDGTSKATFAAGQSPAAIESFIQAMNGGQVDAVIFYGVNPAYEWPKATGFLSAIGKVPLVITVSDREDETALVSDYLAPGHHFLESWGDAQPRKGIASIQQPTLAPIHSTRAFQDSLLAWAKSGSLNVKGLASRVNTGWYDYLRANWKEKYIRGLAGFDAGWENALRDGMVKSDAPSVSARSFRGTSMSRIPTYQKSKANEGLRWVSYQKVSLRNGAQANNPWLQELPDPITTATWDNYAAMSPKTAEKLKVKGNDVVEIADDKGEVFELPVLIQPGLPIDVIAGAVGYGRRAAGKVGTGVGRDISGLFRSEKGEWIASNIALKHVKPTGKRYQIAITQWHNASENRPIVNDITLAEFKANPHTANHVDPHLRLDEVPTMWPKYKYPKYKWGMSIDLNTCFGCGACVVACQAENNIPVVGRDNVRKSREMHWMRIDRYYSGDSDNPDVIFQPMLCQHCDNAPCETVCPVLATVHDDEGLNTQVYNRCVGTRYCQNNCPYKVRRFNFFDHWKSYEGTMNLAWNPDVTVRTRGIMEKCTFCVQRIRDAKDRAKDEGRLVRDGELKTACQQTCPTDAISFGNTNDQKSVVVERNKDERAFRVLEVLNTVPAVSYLTKVRNKAGANHGHGSDAAGHGENHHG